MSHATLAYSGTPTLRVSVSEQTGHTLVALCGDLDVGSAPLLDETLERLRKAGRRSVVVDLSGLTFLDGAGLATFIKARRAFQAVGAELVLREPSVPACRLLALADEADLDIR